MTKNAIAVFAKTPALSPVKTRLATTIGTQEAIDLYTLCVDCAQENLQEFSRQNPDWVIFWALGEQEGVTHNFWENRPFNKIWTGEGALGTRLHTIYATLKSSHDAVILTSTDSPQLSIKDFTEASTHIKKSGNVIGPAHDGGYYLFGDSVNIPKNIWEAVPYSDENTCEELIKLLDKNIPFLTAKSDLDIIEDIDIIINEMPNNKTAAQEKLIEAFKSL